MYLKQKYKKKTIYEGATKNKDNLQKVKYLLAATSRGLTAHMSELRLHSTAGPLAILLICML